MVAAGLGISFGVLIGRLYQVQIVDHRRYQSLARRQHYRRMTIPASRGCVYSSDGEVLALSARVKSLCVDPTLMGDKPSAAARLSRLTGVPCDVLLKRLSRNSRFAWIQRKVPDDEADAALALGIPGLATRDEYDRFYPGGELAGQLLGYVNIDGRGAAGIELTLDGLLRGKPGRYLVERVSGGRLICQPGLPVHQPVAGQDVVLTINSVLQRITEQELAAAAGKWRADRAVAVMIQPRDGSLLAMATWPPFDPNGYRRYPSAQRARLEQNAAAAELYEPGSVFKPFTAAWVLEDGLADERTVFHCGHGCAVINGRALHDVKPYGLLPLEEIIIRSSNIGAARLAVLLGPKRLRQGLARFGFGSKPDLPLPGLSPGVIQPLSRRGPNLTRVPIGYGVSVSALQLCSAFATIANDGRRMRPRLIEKVIDPHTAAVNERPARQIAQVIRPHTARRLRRILEAVVHRQGGTGQFARLDAYAVAGKTGTARRWVAGGYKPGAYNSSFAGFAPANDPCVCVVVTVIHPRGAYYGGVVAAPAVARILRRALAYRGVPPRAAIRDHMAWAPGAPGVN